MNLLPLLASGTITIPLGPMTDQQGVPIETYTLTQAHIRLSKNNGTFAQKNESSNSAHDEAGWYRVTLNSTDLNTLGLFIISVYQPPNGDIMVPFWREFMVVPENVYNIFKSESDGFLKMKYLLLDNTGGSEAGFRAIGGTNRHGCHFVGNGSGHGLYNEAGSTGVGLNNNGSIGQQNQSDGTNQPGLINIGQGTAPGMKNNGGVTGPGQYNVGGPSGGPGILNEGSSNNPGIYNKGDGTASGVLDQGGLSGGDGHQMLCGGGNGEGLSLAGQGTGKDLDANETDNILTNSTEILNSMPGGSNPDATKCASKEDVGNLQNNTKMRVSITDPILIPESGNTLIPICFNFYDSASNPTDPDSDEIAIQARAVNAQVNKTAFFDDETGTVSATASTTFTPDYYKLVKVSIGSYITYYKVPSTEEFDQWKFDFRLKEQTVEMNIRSSVTVTPQGMTIDLADTVATKTVIAEALKEIDLSSVTPVNNSAYSDLLPSNLLAELIDGKTVEQILELILGMSDGKMVFDPITGLTTIYKRDNTTKVTEYIQTNTNRDRT